MSKSAWQEVLANNASLRDIGNWPVLDVTGFDADKLRGFKRNYRAVSEVLNGQAVKVVATQQHMAVSQLYQLLTKCLCSVSGPPPLLTRGLVPYSRQAAARRQQQLSSLKQPSGATFSFTALLEQVEGLEDYLLKDIKRSLNDNPNAQNISIKRFHQGMLWFLKDQGWPQDTYPYTEEKQGYESVRQWIHRTIDALTCYNPKPQLDVTRPLASHLFEVVELDEQYNDLPCKVWLEFLGQYHPIRLSRCCLVLAIDIATDCVFAHTLALTRAPDQDDILDTLQKLYLPERPELRTGLFQYPELTEELSQALKKLSSIQVGEVSLDNALCHLAHSVAELVCQQWGSTLHLGKPRTPKMRNFVEYAFKRLNDDVHRNKATSGSHVRDPKRESAKNQKKPPRITLNELEDMIAVLIESHNHTRKLQLGGVSPIEKAVKALHSGHYMARPAIEYGPFGVHTRRIFRRRLHVSKTEVRAPYINFKSVRYSLHNATRRIPNNIDVSGLYHSHDIRTIKLYDRTTGEFLGDAKVPRRWATYPHSVKTRRYANKVVQESNKHIEDPCGYYYWTIMQKIDKPSYALEYTRMYREFNYAGTTPPPILSERNRDPSATSPHSAVKTSRRTFHVMHRH